MARPREAKRQADKRWKERHPERINACPSRTPEGRRSYSQERYAAAKAAGMCVYCVRVPARETSIICQECQDGLLWAARKRKYGIGKEEFLRLLEDQGHRCAVCRVGIGRNAHVDHDHETKQIRGLLCGHCNRGIGCFRDSPEALDMAAKYLRTRGL